MHQHLNLLFFLFLIIAAVVRLIRNAKENIGEDRPPSPEPQPRDSKMERALREALGNPPNTEAPPKIQPRTNLPPRPVVRIEPPPLFTAGGRNLWERAKAKAKGPRPAPATVERNAPTIPIGISTLRPPVIPKAEPAAAAPAVWRQLLRSPDSLRNAVILREIFGPPRGLQPFDSGTL